MHTKIISSFFLLSLLFPNFLFAQPSNTSSLKPNLKVAVLLPLSGSLSFMGADYRDGIKLCAKNPEIYAFEDHQAQATAGLTAFNNLLLTQGINFGVVSYSNVSSAIIPVAKSRNIPLLLTCVSSAKVAQTGGENVVNFFSTGEQEGPVAAEFLIKHEKAKTAAIIYLQGEFGIAYSSSFADTFKNLGGTVTYNDAFLRDTADYRSMLLKIKTGNPDFLYVIGYDDHIYGILRQAKEIGLKSKLMGNWLVAAPGLRAGHEALMEDLLGMSPKYYISKTAEVLDFDSKYEAKYQRKASAYAAIGCDIANLVNSYGNAGPTEFIKNIRSLKDYNGIIGKLSYKNGELQFPLYPVQIKSGGIEVVK